MHMPAARCSLCYLLCMSACAMHVNLVFCWGVGHIESITESGAHEGGLGVWGDMALCGSNRAPGHWLCAGYLSWCFHKSAHRKPQGCWTTPSQRLVSARYYMVG